MRLWPRCPNHAWVEPFERCTRNRWHLGWHASDSGGWTRNVFSKPRKVAKDGTFIQ